MILILCDDLIFTSKITATARAHHLTATAARTPTALLNKFNTGTACVLIDLHNPELKIAELVPMLRGINPSAKLIGFGSHVDVETLKAAREAGLDKVMPRSQFVNLLETELTAWAKPQRVGGDECDMSPEDWAITDAMTAEIDKKNITS
jgi:DNA-binding NarL/FixJ family response regulator